MKFQPCYNTLITQDVLQGKLSRVSPILGPLFALLDPVNSWLWGPHTFLPLLASHLALGFSRLQWAHPTVDG